MQDVYVRCPKCSMPQQVDHLLVDKPESTGIMIECNACKTHYSIIQRFVRIFDIKIE